MSASRLTYLVALAALTAAACTKEAPDAGTKGPADPWEAPSVTANGETEKAPEDLGGGDLPGPAAGVRRLRIDTLQAAMTKVAGNDVYGAPIFWRVNNRDGFSDLAFGRALGRPDYQTSTEESTVSNALYLKFVGDAARDICMQMAKNDMKRAGASRALFPKAPVDGTATDAEVTENLQYVVLRFLGLRVAADDAMVTNLRAVYDAGVSSVASPNGSEITAAAEGWRGVCVTLFESPLFHND
ncbi:hypothetical protein [Polyangium sorediatum]|uniref:Lipoprotein n=1 Tax=Polyangium sorediatum TaxID=889274 RepID=A0ABT6NIR6_9BACT|nr:hypothetical protein [Polyangium sorediatum]MDI1428213.1 hypothetical protein [Polyangium sorediatum]